MAITRDELKLAGEHFVPGMEATYQNDMYVYGGMSEQHSISGYDEIEFTENSALEMKPLGDEFVKQDWENIDFEKVKGPAQGSYISSRWRDADLARMRENPIPATMQAHQKALARWRSALFRDAATANVNAQLFGQSSFADTALEAGQITGTGAAITLADIYNIGSVYARNHALGNGEGIKLAIAQQELDTLRLIEDLKNKDYNLGAAPAITGEIGNQVGGVQLVIDQDLNVSGAVRTCFAWLPSGVATFTQQAPKIRFEEMQEYNFVPQAYMKTDEGVLRKRRKAVVQLNTLYTY